MNYLYEYEPRRRRPEWDEDPPPPPGGWPKPKGWNAESEKWMEDCAKGGEKYAREQAAIRRAAKGEM